MLDTYLLDDDQPTICPICGSRTDFNEDIIVKAQHHICLNDNCRYEFLVEEDGDNIINNNEYAI